MTRFHNYRSLSNEWREHLESESRKRKRHQQTTWMGIILVLIALAGITIWLGLASSKRDDIENRVKSVHSQHSFALLSGAGVFYGEQI